MNPIDIMVDAAKAAAVCSACVFVALIRRVF